MFTRDTFTPTYSGPILASGESRRRAISDAGATRAFAAERRAYRPMTQGISAGSKAMNYRAALMGDINAASAPTAESAYLQSLAQDAEARSVFDRAAAQERDSLRNLLLDSDSTARTSDLTEREDRYFEELKKRERKAQRRIGKAQRGSGLFGGILGSIF